SLSHRYGSVRAHECGIRRRLPGAAARANHGGSHETGAAERAYRNYGDGAQVARSRCFWILPNALRGSASTTVNDRGTLKDASAARQRSSSAVVSSAQLNTTYATGTSPRSGSGAAAIAASATSGCSSRNSSISRG